MGNGTSNPDLAAAINQAVQQPGGPAALAAVASAPAQPPAPTVQNCPIGFEFAPNGSDCIVPCRRDAGFDLTAAADSSGFSCTYTDDKSITFKLITTPRYQSTTGPAQSATLPNSQVYAQALADYNAKYAIASGKVSNKKRIATAFQNLQDAENVRDQAPEAYEKARVDYYTLTKGDTWIEDEKQRIAATEAAPIANQVLSSFNDLNRRTLEQKQTIDAVNGIKDNILSVADDMKFSVSAFEKQITEIKNQTQLDKKKKFIEIQTYSSWFDLILNIILAVVSGVVLYFVGRAIIKRVRPSPPITPPSM
jgi:hypothetical protein